MSPEEDLAGHSPAQEETVPRPSTPPRMSLKDLVKFNTVQEDAISRVSAHSTKPIRPLEPPHPDWRRFRRELWGKGLNSSRRKEKVVRDDTINDTDILPDPPSRFRFVVPFPKALPKIWSLESRRILARCEYYETEQAALLANKAGVDAFVVTGQPGIGKSFFLLWLLMRRLALRLPTALQVHPNSVVLFHKSGVSQLAYPDDPYLYSQLTEQTDDGLERMEDDSPETDNDSNRPDDDLERMDDDPEESDDVPVQSDDDYEEPGDDPERIWALVDTSAVLGEPARVLTLPKTFFVVNSTSPRFEHLGWLKKVNLFYFYMKPWSFSEIIQARPFIGTKSKKYSEQQLWYLHNEFGASIRDLAMYASDPGRYKDLIIHEIAKVNPDKLHHALNDPFFDNISHLILIVEPSSSRSVYTKRIASRRVFQLLWDRHLRHMIAHIAYFYDLFRTSPTTAVSAGWIFEFRMHQLLAVQRAIRIFPITQAEAGSVNYIYKDYPGENAVDLQWTGSQEEPLDLEGEFIANRYYRPTSTNFPAIDSLLLIHPPDKSPPILLMFQITRNTNEHDVNLGGLQKVDELGLQPNTRKYYVVVTPEGVQPKISVPKKYHKVEGVKPQLPENVLHVFNYPIHRDELFPGH